MHIALTQDASQLLIPIYVLSSQEYDAWCSEQSSFIKNWLFHTHFQPENNRYALLPKEDGTLHAVIAIVKKPLNLWSAAHLPAVLPEGQYTLLGVNEHYLDLALGWCLSLYQFTPFKTNHPKKNVPKLFISKEHDLSELNAMLESMTDVRDWINTPAESMGPSEFSDAMKCVSSEMQANFKETAGNALLSENYPAIHAVGRASSDAPRMLEMNFGKSNHPKLCLVGKGVCFDTGGLNIKTGSNMSLMKKDMGGAAHVLALAKLIMRMKLPISLHVLIPVVENSISGDAYRPGDVFYTRKGLSVEITNTDAEGRVVLADALTRASELKPNLIIDMATLTGAARIALGTEIPMYFSNRREIAKSLQESSERVHDPIWEMPLFPPYRDALKSNVADLCNAPSDSYGGAMTAALFLEEFVDETISWVHFDLMAWNVKARAGRPVGGEAMGFRAVYDFLKRWG